MSRNFVSQKSKGNLQVRFRMIFFQIALFLLLAAIFHDPFQRRPFIQVLIIAIQQLREYKIRAIPEEIKQSSHLLSAESEIVWNDRSKTESCRHSRNYVIEIKPVVLIKSLGNFLFQKKQIIKGISKI